MREDVMKSGTLFFLMLFVVLHCVSVSATGPVLQLQEGSNPIAISVVNNWTYNLKHVAAYVDADELPGWLDISLENGLDVQKGQSGIYNIDFIVDETMIPAAANHIVTLHFRDSMGNQWDRDFTIQVGAKAPLETRLIGNYPNPCNPSTVITYSIGNPANVKINIYNIQGQKIKTLINDHQEPGMYDIRWNGVDDQDNHVASGMYIYRLEAGKYITSNKIMLIQ